MKLHGEMYRKDGQWVIKIESKAWIIDDILNDLAILHKAVKVVIAENPYKFGGQTHIVNNDYVRMETNKPKALIADVGFLIAEKELSKE